MGWRGGGVHNRYNEIVVTVMAPPFKLFPLFIWSDLY